MTVSNNFVYDTIALVQVVPNLKQSQNWLLDRFFPNIVMSDSESVAIDVDVGKRRIQTNEFKPAYIKDKRAPDLRKPVCRAIGEKIGGELTGEEREMANLESEMSDQLDMINRRLEWMAASALTTGTVTISGEGFQT